MASLFLKIRNLSSVKFRKSEISGGRPVLHPEGSRNHPGARSWRAALGGPAGPGRGPGPQPLDLAPRQGDADLADPFQLDAGDRLGVEAREIDDGRGLSPFDGFQIAVAGLDPHRGLFALEARDR